MVRSVHLTKDAYDRTPTNDTTSIDDLEFPAFHGIVQKLGKPLEDLCLLG